MNTPVTAPQDREGVIKRLRGAAKPTSSTPSQQANSATSSQQGSGGGSSQRRAPKVRHLAEDFRSTASLPSFLYALHAV